MPPQEQIEIVSPSGQFRFFELNPATGIVNIGQHPDNDLVLEGRGVRQFHGLIDHRQRPYQYIALDDEGGFAAEQTFSEWEELTIEGHRLVLVSREWGGQGFAAPDPSPHADYAQEMPFAPLPIEASSADVRWRVRPGQTARHNLTIHNSGDSPATFLIHLTGAPPEWLWLSQQEIALQPNGQAAVQIAVTPPLAPETEAGVYPLAWQMTSPDYPGWVQNEALHLQVEAAPAVQLSRPEPLHIVSPLLRRSAHTYLTVANWGNAPALIDLNGQERRGDCLVRIDAMPVEAGMMTPEVAEEVAWGRPQDAGGLAGYNLQLYLPAGGVTHLRVTVSPNKGRYFGLGAIHHRFTVTAQSHEGAFAPLTSGGTFESRPAIRAGLLALLLFALALAGLIAFRDSLSAVSRSRLDPPAAAVALTADRPAWLAPSVENVPRPLLATGGEGRRRDISYSEMFQEIGALYGMDWRLLASQAHRESRLNPNAQGSAGEYGLMQILPATWEEWAPLVQVSDPWDPYSNILVGAAYYSYIHSYFSDLGYRDPQWSLAAYNWGPERTLGLLDRGGDWFSIPLPQRMYVADILIGVENAPALVEEAESRRP